MEAISTELEKPTKVHENIFLKKENWFDNELHGCTFKDARLGRRVAQLLWRLTPKLWVIERWDLPMICRPLGGTLANAPQPYM